MYPLSEGEGKPESFYLGVSVWEIDLEPFFLQKLDVLLACQRNVRMMIEELLLHSPFREGEGVFFGVQYVL